MPMAPSDADILKAAAAFRAAIDKAGQQLWTNLGSTFLRGACGHVAEMLRRYLIERFDIAPKYVTQWAYSDIGG